MARNSENEPTHPPKTNESTTADFTTLPSYIGHQWEHHPNWLGKNQHLFQATKHLKPGPQAGKLHVPEGVPAYGQPRSRFPTGPRCPVSNPKGSHLVMKKTTRKTCALGGFEVLRPWTFQEILVVRSQTYEFNGIIMPFLDGKLQPRCRSTRLRNALLGWSLFQACELGHPTTAVAKKNSFSMRAKGAKSFSSPAQKKNTHKIKDPSSGWSWKKSSNMFSSNLYYQWPWKVMHLSMWQWSPWRKTGKRPYGPSVWDLGEPFSSRDRLCELHSMTWRFGQWVCNG